MYLRVDKWVSGGEETVLSSRRSSISKCRRRNKRTRNLSAEHHGNVASKSYLWKLKLVGKSLRRKRIFAFSRISSSNVFVNYRGENGNLTVEKPDKHHLAKWPWLRSAVMAHWHHVLLMWRTQYHSGSVPARNAQPQSNQEIQFKFRDIVQNNWPGRTTVSGLERWRKIEEESPVRATTATCSLEPWLGSQNRERTLGGKLLKSEWT